MQGRGDYTQGQYYADGSPIGNPAQSDWLKDTPWGFRKILNWVKYRCGKCLTPTYPFIPSAHPLMICISDAHHPPACCNRGVLPHGLNIRCSGIALRKAWRHIDWLV